MSKVDEAIAEMYRGLRKLSDLVDDVEDGPEQEEADDMADFEAEVAEAEDYPAKPADEDTPLCHGVFFNGYAVDNVIPIHIPSGKTLYWSIE